MLAGKVAIVTGAASGIGLMLTKGLVADGIKVVMADINEEALQRISGELGCEYKVTDLSKRESCRELVDYTAEKLGGVDILVNVAGIQHVCPIEEFPEEKWDFIISLMLTAPFNLTKYVWPYMKEKGWGRIVNISSIHGLVASDYKSAYISAKHGLIGLTKTAALEGGPQGITCNAICPAYVLTPLVEKQIADQAKHHGISEDEVIEKIMLAKSAVKKLIPEETIVAAARFLISEEAEAVTGVALPLDGGWVVG